MSHSRFTPIIGRRSQVGRLSVAAAAVVALAGCASTAVDGNFADVQQLSRERLGTDVKWLTTDEARRQAETDVDALLAKPLGSDDAARIALAYSPALQSLLYEAAASSAAATQSARLPNPVFAFERLARNEGGARELEITRSLSFSVLDLLLLPARLRLADYQQQAARLTLASNVVQAALDARQAWVRAVAAQQALQYAQQVKATADASAEIARRMQAVGNFSKLQRAREQAFAADAVAQLARAAQAARSSRETLVRSLGLNDRQAGALKLPERLPELPSAPREEGAVARTAMDQRIDVRMARANLDFIAREQGLMNVTSYVNGLELGKKEDKETGLPRQRGYDLSVPLPIFDFGDASRSRAQATYMAALNRTAQLTVEASSRVREDYGAYRTAYDIAKHYRDEIVPLRKTIAEENILRYNGMLIGVFELLADSREQITSVMQAIEAQRDFWLADATLQTSLIGRPMSAMSMTTQAGAAGTSRGPGPAANH
ncbi:MAG: TolC family protein [Caldimonas sp.]